MSALLIVGVVLTLLGALVLLDGLVIAVFAAVRVARVQATVAA